MPKEFTYLKRGILLFRSIEENYVSMETVDKKVLEKTGQDPRLDPFIERQVRVVDNNIKPSVGRFDRNKKTQY